MSPATDTQGTQALPTCCYTHCRACQQSPLMAWGHIQQKQETEAVLFCFMHAKHDALPHSVPAWDQQQCDTTVTPPLPPRRGGHALLPGSCGPSTASSCAGYSSRAPAATSAHCTQLQVRQLISWHNKLSWMAHQVSLASSWASRRGCLPP